MNARARLRSIAVAVPDAARRNDYWRSRYPDLVAAAEREFVDTPWRADDTSDASRVFDEEMRPYLRDPFRGAKIRRVLARGETVLALECRAARGALECAGVATRDIDLLIASSFLPDQVGIGNATFLARELGLHSAAWNLEATCSSALVALETACGLIVAGQRRRVLVVTSCSYSRTIEDHNVLAWTAGDGASAFVVERADAGDGLLGFHTMHTGATCGAFAYELALDSGGAPTVKMTASRAAGRVLRETSGHYVRMCCMKALQAAGVETRDVDLLVCNTPTAWFARFAARVMGIDPVRTVDTFPLYGNVGPALWPVNLHHAAATRRLRYGDLVLLHSIGSASAASAAVLRWDDVRVGPAPRPV
ncbi:3-oxoacyl-[acyl-carrier-protein] synthase-3 [Nannocystis exedens]|uniref:3-oxoacyl-[acyl-carrier-protein] synthase-3 n=1 Tax=Nannocystis exedens TaxID=54 RepID=A0A1I2I760_9BACT|nr:3-oxoacyl-[acyl-carrier-protein] synthase III C-terminal domain-containing protein [Nannocystis exedens]PCC74129.1 3-oxoacyl-(acyl-carrier-protein) synthase III [Nannocystis exedens]SFF38064.1 3-oxoacyl-[acyl-carrier-protein] synthase-3 [Nannocystis exedens]